MRGGIMSDFYINTVIDKKFVYYCEMRFLVDRRVNWLAVDKDGKLYSYRKKPSIDNLLCNFESQDIHYLRICEVYFDGDWRESLVYVGDQL